MAKVLDYGEARREAIVRYNGKDYRLVEASEEDQERFLAPMRKRAKVTEGQKVEMGNVDISNEFSLQLVSSCLYDGDDRVPVAKLRNWPGRIVKDILLNLVRMSGMAPAEGKDQLLQSARETLIKIVKDLPTEEAREALGVLKDETAEWLSRVLDSEGDGAGVEVGGSEGNSPGRLTRSST